MIAIDFETYYDTKSGFSVKTMGASAYTQDPRFYTTMVSIYSKDLKYVGPVEEFDWSKLRKQRLIAHNVGFDELVYKRLVQDKVIDKVDAPLDWTCTADLCAYSKYNRALGVAVKAKYGVALDKSIRKEMGSITVEQAKAQGKYEAWKEYAIFDALYCYKLWQDLGDKWSLLEQKISRSNREIGYKGVPIDREALEKGIATIETKLWELEQDIPWDWSMNKTPLSRLAFVRQCRELGLPIPKSCAKTDVAFIKWVQQYAPSNPWIKAVTGWRPTNTFLLKLKSMKARLTSDNWMPYSVKYHEAHTGRFSGAGGVNVQNFNRDSFYGVNIRHMIKAPEGHKLVVADFSQIEPRVLSWLTGDIAFLKGCVDKSPYVVHAINTMGWDKAKDLKKEAPSIYALAKARVLGLGYGCGAEKFRGLAKGYGVELTEAESQNTVKEYRRTNPLITSYWKNLQQSLVLSRNEDLEVTLPSGRELVYYGVHRVGNELAATVKRGNASLNFYGGKIAENITQAVARDVFAMHMPALQDQMIMHVHDEYVMCLKEDELDIVPDIEKLVTTTPSWLKGCPLATEALIMDKYEK